jgi:predicted secreted protein
MDWFTGIAVYITIWWVMLFVMLPMGATSQHEAGDVVAGTEPGAPVLANMKKKLVWTSMAAAVVWAGLALVIQSGLISLDRPVGGLTPDVFGTQTPADAAK